MEQITAEQLKTRLNAGEHLNVLDVREKEEYEEVNIGAKLLPLSALRQMDFESIENWKDSEVIVHCRSGKRSLEACMILESLGFTQTVNLTGGIVNWIQKYGTDPIEQK